MSYSRHVNVLELIPVNTGQAREGGTGNNQL